MGLFPQILVLHRFHDVEPGALAPGFSFLYNTSMILENRKSGFVTLLEYGVYGFFAIFPFFIFRTFLYQGSSSRFLLLTLVSAVLAIFLGVHLFYKKNNVTFFKSPLLVLCGVYLAYLFVSALLGVDFHASFWSRAERTSGLFYLTHLALFVFLLIQIVSHKESREKLLKVILYTSALYSICSLLGPQGFKVLFLSNPYDGFMFGNSSFAAMYLLGALLLSLYYLFSKTKSEIRTHEYALPFLIVLNPFLLNLTRLYTGVTSVLGAAKASSIALFAALGILFVIWLISLIKNNRTKKQVGIGFFVVSLGVLGYVTYSLLTPGTAVRKIYEQESTLARPLMWEISEKSISQKPITGWGIDNFPTAFQQNFDIRFLTERYGNEPWFDRAHNIILDQGVDTGYLGIVFYIVIYLVIFLLLLRVLLTTKDRHDGVLASVLITYFFVHFLELQTAFDTTISYPMLALMLALTIYVVHKTNGEKTLSVSEPLKYIAGTFCIVYFGWSLFFGILPFWKVQSVNGQIRTVGSAEKRIPLYEELFSTKVDRAGILWRTSTDFQKGIAESPVILENPEKVTLLVEELGVITKGYEEYVANNRGTFRPHLNLADMYIYHMLFGVDRLADADAVLDTAIAISDKYPQPYWMKAVIALYRRDFAGARAYVQKAEAMNAEVVETLRLEKYIEDSIKTFPEIDLYFFNQI